MLMGRVCDGRTHVVDQEEHLTRVQSLTTIAKVTRRCERKKVWKGDRQHGVTMTAVMRAAQSEGDI